MKKIISLLLTLIISSTTFTYVSAKDEYLGDALYSSTVGLINGYYIPTYTYKGYAYIIAEDLREFGIHVDWNEYSKKLSIWRHWTENAYLRDKSKFKPWAESLINKKAFSVYSTDVAVTCCGDKIEGFRTGTGYTMINFNHLGYFGKVSYYASTVRYRDAIYASIGDLSLTMYGPYPASRSVEWNSAKRNLCQKCGGSGEIYDRFDFAGYYEHLAEYGRATASFYDIYKKCPQCNGVGVCK